MCSDDSVETKSMSLLTSDEDDDDDDDDDDNFRFDDLEEAEERPLSGEKHFNFVFVQNTAYCNSYNTLCRTQYI